MVITIIGMIIITTGQCPMKAVFNGCYKRKTSFAPWSSVSTDGQILLVSTDGLILSVSADGRILLSWIEHKKLWIRFVWILLIICSAKFFYFWARSNSHCGVCIITCNGTFRLLRMCTSFLLRIKCCVRCVFCLCCCWRCISAKPACLWDSWGTKYKRDSEPSIGNQSQQNVSPSVHVHIFSWEY